MYVGSVPFPENVSTILTSNVYAADRWLVNTVNGLRGESSCFYQHCILQYDADHLHSSSSKVQERLLALEQRRRSQRRILLIKMI